jgi:hypothetical protein
VGASPRQPQQTQAEQNQTHDAQELPEDQPRQSPQSTLIRNYFMENKPPQSRKQDNFLGQLNGIEMGGEISANSL